MADFRELKSNYQLHQHVHDLESLFLKITSSSARRNHLPQPHPSRPFLRGPMYEAYSLLRESRLRQMKAEPFPKTTPKKKVSFLSGTSAVAQSVPDFSSMLRKENKRSNWTPKENKRPNWTPEVTPPSTGAKGGWRGGGLSKSATGGEKRGGGAASAMRKSCMNLRELKGLSAAVASAIDEEGKGGRSKGIMKKTILGSRHY